MFKMIKKEKLKTPGWIMQGYNTEADYNKVKGLDKKKTGHHLAYPFVRNSGAKIFKIRKCPKCDSDDVAVVIGGEEGKGSKGWQCKKCGWKGTDVQKQELNEEEMMKYLDEKGEEVN